MAEEAAPAWTRVSGTTLEGYQPHAPKIPMFLAEHRGSKESLDALVFDATWRHAAKDGNLSLIDVLQQSVVVSSSGSCREEVETTEDAQFAKIGPFTIWREVQEPRYQTDSSVCERRCVSHTLVGKEVTSQRKVGSVRGHGLAD